MSRLLQRSVNDSHIASVGFFFFYLAINGSFIVLNWKLWHPPESQAQGVR